MNLLERVLTLLGANLRTVVENADDPEQVLRQLQIDLRNQLVQVKTQVATAIAESHKVQKRDQERKAEADKWLKKAESAVQQGNDHIARDALKHYNEVNRQIQRYQQQRESQEQLVNTMRNALRQLEAKITEVDTTIDLLVTRKRSAIMQQRISEALNKSASPKDKERTTKAQDSLLDIEARVQALAHLQDETLETQTEPLDTHQETANQLQTIKEQNPTALQPLQANEPGEPRRQTSPLTSSPQPLERTHMPDQQRPKKGKVQTEPIVSQELDVEELKRRLGYP